MLQQGFFCEQKQKDMSNMNIYERQASIVAFFTECFVIGRGKVEAVPWADGKSNLSVPKVNSSDSVDLTAKSRFQTAQP